jgi:hypothetical protein
MGGTQHFFRRTKLETFGSTLPIIKCKSNTAEGGRIGPKDFDSLQWLFSSSHPDANETGAKFLISMFPTYKVPTIQSS